MENDVISGVVAVAVGLALAVVLFVPFVWLNYRRDGRLTVSRTLLWVGFLVYAMALWTYTLLPLPDPTDIVCRGAQTRPLQFVDDIRAYNTSSTRALLTNPAVLQVALNVVFFVPLGLFLRLLWGRGILWSAVAGFAVSLFIETTQYTGVWGIYSCAYRFFDVDDLLANTSGAVIGAVLAAVVAWLHGRLVRRSGADSGEDATSGDTGVPTVGEQVSRSRRTVGAACDLLVVALLTFGSAAMVNIWQIVVDGRNVDTVDANLTEQVSLLVPLVVSALVVLVTGRTIGDHAVEIRFGPVAGRRSLPAWVRRVLRFLAGIGGLQLLGLAAPADLLFLLVGVAAVLFSRERGGLPGLLSGTRPVSTFAPDTPEESPIRA
ncbi:MAG: VanZ family protein [Corynebacterium variabile]|uniref:VanZ family protein n=1 Tax=Corynebacterium variabile TaxID=1727 RepID=UPI003F8EFCB3